MKPIVCRSTPKGLEVASVVLRQHGAEDAKIRNWVERQQELSLADNGRHRLEGASAFAVYQDVQL